MGILDMSRIAQKIPEEEVQKDQVTPKNVGNRFKDWAQRWKGQLQDLGGFMNSVWENPYEFDVDWHENNSRRRQTGKGKKMNWYQWSRLSPQLRKLYKQR